MKQLFLFSSICWCKNQLHTFRLWNRLSRVSSPERQLRCLSWFNALNRFVFLMTRRSSKKEHDWQIQPWPMFRGCQWQPSEKIWTDELFNKESILTIMIPCDRRRFFAAWWTRPRRVDDELNIMRTRVSLSKSRCFLSKNSSNSRNSNRFLGLPSKTPAILWKFQSFQLRKLSSYQDPPSTDLMKELWRCRM